MTKVLRKLANEWIERECDEDDIRFDGGSTSTNKLMRAYVAAANPAAILELLDRVEKAERLLSELREAAAAVVSNEEHAFSGGMRKYAEGSQTWQVYEDLRIAMEASK